MRCTCDVGVVDVVADAVLVEQEGVVAAVRRDLDRVVLSEEQTVNDDKTSHRASMTTMR